MCGKSRVARPHHSKEGADSPIAREPVYSFGKSEQGLTNGGLNPKFSEKIGGKSALKIFRGPIQAFSGLMGTRAQFRRTPQPRGKSRNCLKGPFLAQLVPFGPSPHLLSPHLDFPDINSHLFFNFGLFWGVGL